MLQCPEKNCLPLILITGTNRGIGFKLAEKLLGQSDAKFDLLLTSRDETKGFEVIEIFKNAFPKSGSNLLYHQLDISNEESIEKLVEWLRHHNRKIFCLVNNAAIADRKDWTCDPNFQRSKEFIELTINTNTYGTINLTESLLPFLEDCARIITLTSYCGELQHQGDEIKIKLTDPLLTKNSLVQYIEFFKTKAIAQKHKEAGFYPSIYHASKVFLNAYMRFVLPQTLQQNQSCVVVNPGWVNTEMGGIDAPGTVEEGCTSTLYCLKLKPEEFLQLKGGYLNTQGELTKY